jgi:hypothetical protein
LHHYWQQFHAAWRTIAKSHFSHLMNSTPAASTIFFPARGASARGVGAIQTPDGLRDTRMTAAGWPDEIRREDTNFTNFHELGRKDFNRESTRI